jgi:hypothetical protein
MIILSGFVGMIVGAMLGFGICAMLVVGKDGE